jgi:hypothetical protein
MQFHTKLLINCDVRQILALHFYLLNKRRGTFIQNLIIGALLQPFNKLPLLFVVIHLAKLSNLSCCLEKVISNGIN